MREVERAEREAQAHVKREEGASEVPYTRPRDARGEHINTSTGAGAGGKVKEEDVEGDAMDQEEEGGEEEDADAAAMAAMGFGGFGTTKVS